VARRGLYWGRVLLDFVWLWMEGRGLGDVWLKLNSDFYVHGRRWEGQDIENAVSRAILITFDSFFFLLLELAGSGQIFYDNR
jgi:hypothetical protein